MYTIGTSYKILHSKTGVICLKNVFRTYSNTIKCKTPSLNYCINSVRTHDYEGFLCSLLLPDMLRTAAMIIRAFNVEIATVQDQVSEQMIGAMRFQFWDDVIDDIFKDLPPSNPICEQLHKLITRKKLSKRYFKRLVSARKDYKLKTIDDIKSVESYCEDSVSPVYYLLLEAADTKDVNADHAASHLGKSQGISNMLRSIPYYANKNLVFLPKELLLKHSVSEESIVRGVVDQKLKDVVFEIASSAYIHLETMKKLEKKVDKNTKLILLPSVTVENYLKRLRWVDFDVFSPKLQVRNPTLSTKLYWRKLIV